MHDTRLIISVGDVTRPSTVKIQMGSVNVAINATSYRFNPHLTKIAIETRTNFCDLGGNNDVVQQQFELNAEAKAREVKIIPDCGMAPGAISILTVHAMDELRSRGREPHSVRLRVGGLPQDPQGPLGYMKLFSMDGLINECHEPAEVIRHGARILVEPLTALETVTFPQPFGQLEAVITSGGTSTMTRTFEGQLQNLDYKTLRYPHHWEQIITLRNLGFFEGSGPGSPRAVTMERLEKATDYKGKDALLMRVEVDSPVKEGVITRVRYEMAALQNERHTAMQQTTGYSIAIVAQMMAKGEIEANGVLEQELHVPVAKFVNAWKERGLNFYPIVNTGRAV